MAVPVASLPPSPLPTGATAAARKRACEHAAALASSVILLSVIPAAAMAPREPARPAQSVAHQLITQSSYRKAIAVEIPPQGGWGSDVRSLSAHGAGVSPMQMWQRWGPVAVQMWAG